MNGRNATSLIASCPYADRVRALAAGSLEVERTPFVEEHLARCPMCGALLDALDETSDAIIRQLATLPASMDDEPEFRWLEARLTSGTSVFAHTLTGRVASRLADPALGPLPQRLGNYELLARIGRGAWGAVYRARHVKLEQIVAVKVLDAERLQSHLAIDRFIREMRAVGQLRHPNIVRATDAGDDRGFHYLVMEFIDGIDAARLLQRAGRLRVADACEIVRQAAAALDFAHGRGWIHRDVKPSNLMIAPGGIVKLLDLGIAGGHDDVDHDLLIGQTAPLGTIGYMAPEQWTNFAAVDAQADVFSLGCTLFKLLTGHLPYDGRPPLALDGKEAPPSVARHCTDVRKGLDRLVQRMLALNLDERVATAAEIADSLAPWSRRADLARLVNEACGRDAATDDGPHSRLRAETRTRRSLTRRRLLIGGGAALAGTFLLAPWFLPWRSPQLRRAEWRALRPTPPTILLALEDPQGVRLQIGEQDRIAVESEDLVMVHLGRAVSGVLALRVKLQQAAWQSGAGVFFQYRQNGNSPFSYEFQTIELRPVAAPNASKSGNLLWSHCTAVVEDGQVAFHRDPWAEIEVELDDEETRQDLEVVLGRSGLPEVEWNGRLLVKTAWTLSTEGRRQASLAPDRVSSQYLGRLGLVNLGGATTFFSPQLAYL